MSGDRRVVVVTGGGAGIGAAVAEELGRQGCFVVTVDPLLTIDGSAPLPDAEDTTAGRIVAAGGTARASSASVTDGVAIKALFTELVAEHGRLDAVINVAGITRPTSYASGTDEDWRSVLEVHFHGYLNVLAAALPIMTAAGHGRILGVTSGSGWRAADAGAYSCAKRAVAALTWQLGRVLPPGVTVNAMSPIAVTRMVTAALERAAAAAAARPGGAANATGGLSLGSMPEPEEIGPFGAHLVDESLDWLRGQVLFAGGPEVAVIEEPRLLEVLRTDGIESLASVIEAVSAGALVPAEAGQASTGASNPRFTAAFDGPTTDLPASAVRSAAVVTDRPVVGTAIAAALEARGVTVHLVPTVATDVAGAGAVLTGLPDVEAVVVAAARTAAPPAATAGEQIVADHAVLVDEMDADAAWSRAASAADRPLRLVTVTDAVTAGGRSRAQAVAQLSRSSRKTTKERVAGFSVSMEGADVRSASELVAHLVASPDALALSGAELATGDGWLGLRSHPRPLGSVVLGGPVVPDWLDPVIRDIVGAPAEEAP